MIAPVCFGFAITYPTTDHRPDVNVVVAVERPCKNIKNQGLKLIVTENSWEKISVTF